VFELGEHRDWHTGALLHAREYLARAAMSRFVSFLRAINVGGHTVTMADLRRHFAALGLNDVETFIASGNVVFTTRSKDAKALERKIEAHLRAALGYEVITFVRTLSEVDAVARYRPFPEAQIKAAGALNVAFLAEPASEAARKGLMAHRSATDDFHIYGREAYWLTRTRQSDSPFFKVGMEKALKMRATVRGMNTIVKLSAKYQDL
jgi:uncharacterized protein (DUF1697 family)